ncbi:MAG: DHH family phosphoesterase [Acidobacteriota bacterium]|nr:DHH family phosphoesterase [Acidobacteriota bacterium]
MPHPTPNHPTHWQPREADPTLAQSLADHLRCPLPIAHILTARTIHTPEAAQAFLHPHLSQLHSPLDLLGIAPAVARILQALRTHQPILIYGDYDVDGTTATVLLKTTLERIAHALDPTHPADIRYHVPHRIREGYGMQSSVLASAHAAGVRLVISVDTGIRAFAEAAEARALALDLIVTDHHLPETPTETTDPGAPPSAIASPSLRVGSQTTSLPDCLAVINPSQPGCPYPNKNLCGAAVAFKLAHALLLAAAPLTADPAAFNTRTEAALLPSFLKLVAIATVADAVPLTGENRALAALGLAALANPVQPGLRALMELAGLPLDQAPTASEVAFRLAPRINAAGRMDIASDVVELFLTRDAHLARTLAEKLDALNTARRDTEAHALTAIDALLSALLADHPAYPADCLILDHPDWHPGVLGILASRIVERTHRPALVLTHAGGDAQGSGRSIPGFHLLQALEDAHAADPAQPTPLFHRFGGHAHAVGFSLPSTSLPQLRTRISAHAALHLSPALLTPTLTYDALLTPADITPELHHWLLRLAPFGHGNPEPLFLLPGVTLASAPRLIKQRHICLELILPHTATTVSALGWTRGASPTAAPGPTDWPARCERLHLAAGSTLDLLVRLRRKTGAYANSQLAGLELELCDLRLPSAHPRPFEPPPATALPPSAEISDPSV